MCVCTSIKPGRHVAFERSTIVEPLDADDEFAAPTAVIVPDASNEITWSVSNLPERTSSSFPHFTAPGAPGCVNDFSSVAPPVAAVPGAPRREGTNVAAAIIAIAHTTAPAKPTPAKN